MTEVHKESRGGWQAVALRFSPPEMDPPNPVALAAAVITSILRECHDRHTDPVGLVSVAVGPAGDLVSLFDRLKKERAETSPATLATDDQAAAAFAEDPDRFAALAFAHVVEREP